MVLRAIWKKTRMNESLKDYQNNQDRCEENIRKGMSEKYLPDFPYYLLCIWKYFPLVRATTREGLGVAAPVLLVGGLMCALLVVAFLPSFIKATKLSKLPWWCIGTSPSPHSYKILGFSLLDHKVSLNVPNWKQLWNDFSTTFSDFKKGKGFRLLKLLISFSFRWHLMLNHFFWSSPDC